MLGAGIQALPTEDIIGRKMEVVWAESALTIITMQKTIVSTEKSTWAKNMAQAEL